jgi:hypothetical protein
MNADGTVQTYNVLNALVNLSLGRIDIYWRVFKLALTVTGLTQY